jgi:hypothetical protein
MKTLVAALLLCCACPVALPNPPPDPVAPSEKAQGKISVDYPVSGGHEVFGFWRAGSHLFLGRSSSLIAQRRVFFLAWFFFPPDSSARAAAAQMC